MSDRTSLSPTCSRCGRPYNSGPCAASVSVSADVDPKQVAKAVTAVMERELHRPLTMRALT